MLPGVGGCDVLVRHAGPAAGEAPAPGTRSGRAGRGLLLRPGLTLAVEPWFARTTDRVVTDADGWSLRSADGSATAHTEHTLAVTEGGARVLTA
ncbi:hypothetical protein GCM10027174_25520 [Salinifilum aidingensis]